MTSGVRCRRIVFSYAKIKRESCELARKEFERTRELQRFREAWHPNTKMLCVDAHSCGEGSAAYVTAAANVGRRRIDKEGDTVG